MTWFSYASVPVWGGVVGAADLGADVEVGVGVRVVGVVLAVLRDGGVGDGVATAGVVAVVADADDVVSGVVGAGVDVAVGVSTV